MNPTLFTRELHALEKRFRIDHVTVFGFAKEFKLTGHHAPPTATIRVANSRRGTLYAAVRESTGMQILAKRRAGGYKTQLHILKNGVAKTVTL